MANLFWKTDSSTKTLLDRPFSSENELESLVFSTAQLLEDIFLIRRQVRGGGKSGIPDIVGVDSEGNVCIIELKNVAVDAGIIPQVLEYAIWAERNPDSIKSLWLESRDKPDDLSIDWESFQVRILIIGPSIHRTTLQFVEKIGYPVELIEVKRWVEGKNQFLMLNRLEPEIRKGRARPAKGLSTYDEAFYRSHYNSESARHFLTYAREIEKLVARRAWQLEMKFNRNSCVFKAGFFNAFSLRWVGSKTFALSFRLPEKQLKTVKIPVTRYNKKRGRALYYVEPDKTRIAAFDSLFEACYRQISAE